MGRLPKDKVALSIYVTPECKKKLDCLQKLYAIGDRKFSLSQIVEESINFLYFVAYFSQKNSFWSGFFGLFNKFLSEDALNEMVGNVLQVVKDKKSSAKEVLTVKVSFKGNWEKVKKKKK